MKISNQYWQQTGRSITGELESCKKERCGWNKATATTSCLLPEGHWFHLHELTIFHSQGDEGKSYFSRRQKNFFNKPKTQTVLLLPLSQSQLLGIFSLSECLYGLYSKSHTPALGYFVLYFHCFLQVSFVFPDRGQIVSSTSSLYRTESNVGLCTKEVPLKVTHQCMKKSPQGERSLGPCSPLTSLP